MIKKMTPTKRLLSFLFFLCSINMIQAQSLIGDIDATPTKNDFSPFDNYLEVGDYLYFTSTTEANGRELFMLDFNTDEVTTVDINPGPEGSNIKDIHIFGDYFYFTANDGKRGQELWKVNVGTLDTAMIDINGDATSSFPESEGFFELPPPFVEVGGKIYFPAANNGDTELYMITKGMLDTTSININPEESSFPKQFLVVEDQLYLVAETGRVAEKENPFLSRNELIIVEGGTLDTTIVPGTGGIQDDAITIAGDYLYFVIVEVNSEVADLHFLQKGSTESPTKVVTMLDFSFSFFNIREYFYDKLYFSDIGEKLYYTTPGSPTIDTIVTPNFGNATRFPRWDGVSELYYEGSNQRLDTGQELFVLKEGATTSIKTGIDVNRFFDLTFYRERNNKLFMQQLSADSIAIVVVDLATYEPEIVDIRPGNFLFFGDFPLTGETFSDELVFTPYFNQLITTNMETSEITVPTLLD